MKLSAADQQIKNRSKYIDAEVFSVLAPKSLLVCGLCGTAVLPEYARLHLQWHEKIRRAIEEAEFPE